MRTCGCGKRGRHRSSCGLVNSTPQKKVGVDSLSQLQLERPRLSPGEERALGLLAAQGDQTAKAQIMAIVDSLLQARVIRKYFSGSGRSIEHSYHPPGLEFEDLMQEARIGAWLAMPRYDETTLPRTWLVLKAMYHLKDYLRYKRSAHGVHFGSGVRGKLVDPCLVGPAYSIDRVLRENREGEVTSPEWEDPRGQESLHHIEARDEVVAALSGLTYRTTEILCLHYGEGISLKDIGMRVGISAGRVSQILHKSVYDVRKRRVVV